MKLHLFLIKTLKSSLLKYELKINYNVCLINLSEFYQYFEVSSPPRPLSPTCVTHSELLSFSGTRRRQWRVSACCCWRSLYLMRPLRGETASWRGGRGREAPECFWRSEYWWCLCSAPRRWRTVRRRGWRSCTQGSPPVYLQSNAIVLTIFK